jgi:hypothetical protein
MTASPDDAYDAGLEPDGAASYDAHLDGASVTPPGMPITVLGLWGDHYWFIDAVGQRVSRTPQQMLAKGPLMGLFHGNTAWPEVAAPVNDKEGQPILGAVHFDRLGMLLMRACAARPLYNPDTPLRGVGVWRVGDTVLVHLGNRILDLGTGRAIAPGFSRGNAVWPAWQARLPKASASAPELPPPAPASLGAELVRRLGLWTWEAVEGPEVRAVSGAPAAARILAGYVAAAMLGAAIPWRPHVLLVAQGGSGKTTLIEMIEPLLPFVSASNDFTEAGLRQSLTGTSGALLLDEADATPETMERLQRVVDMLRRASGGKGARSVRGSAGGVSQTFEVTVSALLGSVHAPPLNPADASRFTRLDLLAPRDGATPLDKAELVGWAEMHGPALFARVLAGQARFDAVFAAFRRAMITGPWASAPRQADQLGTLLAGWWVLTQDGQPSPEAVEDAIEHLGDLLCTGGEQAHEQGPTQCLTHLLGASANVTIAGERVTLGYLVDEVRREEHAAQTDLRRLRDHGLAWVRLPPAEVERALSTASLDMYREPFAHAPTEAWIKGPGLFVASSHVQLAHAFRGSTWEGGKWIDDLRRLPSAITPRTSIAVGAATKWRGVWLPAPLLAGMSDP